MSLNTILATTPLTSTGYHLKATGTTIGNSLIWDNGTNVGIGNTNTSYTLDVSGTGRFTGALTGAASTWSGNITIQKTAPNILMKGGYTQDLAFFLNNEPSVYLVDDATATKGIRVNISTGAFTQLGGGASSFSGNVGIGTDSPVTKLDVVANSDATALTLRMRTADNFAFLQFRNNAGTQVISEIYSNRTADNTGSLIFTTNNGGSATERMRITSGGEVAINRTDGGGGRLAVRGATSGGGANAFYVDNSSSAQLFSVRNDGIINTGLLTYSPYNFSITGRDVYVNSSGELGYLSSTRESKTNISSVSDINWISQLNPVSFNYRKKDDEMNYTEEFYDDKSFGFIADEVEKINPDFVFYDINEDGSKKLAGVKYQSMTAILTKIVQEQQIQIQNLQEQINILAK